MSDPRGAFPGLKTSCSEADRVFYARDLWPRHHLDVRAGRVAEHRPAAIVWPETTEDVAAIVRWGIETRTPLVPFGAGSGVCGGILPTSDAVIVDIKKMDRIRSIDGGAPSVVVEAGAMGLPFEEELGRRGFTLGHFPSSILCSTVGGWVAARSAGQASGRYGKIEDMIVSLEAVTGAGEIVNLPRRLHGPDLASLVTGSEGTMAIVTAATLRLHPAPTTRGFASWSFASTEAGWDAMRAIFQAGLRPAVLRLYDPFDAMLARRGGVKAERKPDAARAHPHAPGLGFAALRALLKHPTAFNEILDWRASAKAMGGALLVAVFDGNGDEALRDVEAAKRLVAAHDLRATYDGEGPARRWLEHRYAISYRQAPTLAGGLFLDTMEVATTWSNLGRLYDRVREALGEGVFVMAHLSHAYPDGCCIYFSFAGRGADSSDAGWDDACLAAYDATWKRALAAAESAGGTIAHHHGVGRSKAPKLSREIGPGGVKVVEALKRAFDPAGILNPGALGVRGEPALAEATGEAAPIALDATSLLVDVGAEVSLGALDEYLGGHGLTVGARGPETVGTWLARGGKKPGEPPAWSDPADHLVAGIVYALPSGDTVTLRAAPRRATGPDLVAIASGMGGRFARVLRATLRVHVRGKAPRGIPFAAPPEPPASPLETSLLDRIETELARA